MLNNIMKGIFAALVLSASANALAETVHFTGSIVNVPYQQVKTCEQQFIKSDAPVVCSPEQAPQISMAATTTVSENTGVTMRELEETYN